MMWSRTTSPHWPHFSRVSWDRGPLPQSHPQAHPPKVTTVCWPATHKGPKGRQCRRGQQSARSYDQTPPHAALSVTPRLIARHTATEQRVSKAKETLQMRLRQRPGTILSYPGEASAQSRGSLGDPGRGRLTEEGTMTATGVTRHTAGLSAGEKCQECVGPEKSRRRLLPAPPTHTTLTLAPGKLIWHSNLQSYERIPRTAWSLRVCGDLSHTLVWKMNAPQ